MSWLVFYWCDKTPWPRETWEKERVYFSSQLSGHTPSWREVRAGPKAENLEAGTRPKAMEEHYLLAWPPGLLGRFLYTPGPLTQGWYHPQQAESSFPPSHQSLIKKSPMGLFIYRPALQRCFSQLKFLPSTFHQVDKREKTKQKKTYQNTTFAFTSTSQVTNVGRHLETLTGSTV